MLPRIAVGLNNLRPVRQLKSLGRRAASLGRVLGWGLALWLATVAVPYGFLYPEAGTAQTACLVLAAVAPLGMLLAALATAEATPVLGAGLLGLLPILIACPALQGERTTGPLPSLLVAVLAVTFFASAWNHGARHLARHHAEGADPTAGSLRRLARLPPGQVDRLVLALGALWLAQAWWLPEGETAESDRAARVAGAAVCWVAVRLLPLRGDLPQGEPGTFDRWPLYVGRRVAWLALFGGLLWLWRRSA